MARASASSCPAAWLLPRAAGIELLLQTEPEFACAIERTLSSPFDDDADYMLAAELRFTLTSLHLQMLCTLRTLAVGGSRRPIYADRTGEAAPSSACSPSETARRVRALRDMRDNHVATMAKRLGATMKVPRVVAVADAYGLSDVEASVLELLVLQRTHRTELFASCLQAVDDGYDAHAIVPTLSGASSLQLAAFFEEVNPSPSPNPNPSPKLWPNPNPNPNPISGPGARRARRAARGEAIAGASCG